MFTFRVCPDNSAALAVLAGREWPRCCRDERDNDLNDADCPRLLFRIKVRVRYKCAGLVNTRAVNEPSQSFTVPRETIMIMITITKPVVNDLFGSI